MYKLRQDGGYRAPRVEPMSRERGRSEDRKDSRTCGKEWFLFASGNTQNQPAQEQYRIPEESWPAVPETTGLVAREGGGPGERGRCRDGKVTGGSVFGAWGTAY